MTNEEKARAYDEALKDMRVIYPNLRGYAKLAVEHAFPELAESEDERIRKEMIRYFTEMKKGGSVALPYDDCIAYLENKGSGIKWFKSDNVKNPDKPYIDKAGMFYTTDGRMCHASEIEKQKEQKPSQTDTEKEYVQTLKSLISDFLHGKQEIDTGYYQQICDWLDGRHIEQKVLPGFDGLTPEEKMNHPLYLEGFDVERDVQKVFDEQKQEWGEDDERILNELLDHCNTENATWYNWLKSLRPQQKQNNMITPNKKFFQWIYDRLINVHKEDPNVDYMISFKKRIEESSWKPSEEQMLYLLAVINEPNNAGSESCHLVLKELYEQLKTL